MARPKRPSPPDRDGDGNPGGSLPGNETAPEAKGPWIDVLEVSDDETASDAPVASEVPTGNMFTNTSKTTTIHLGDGRKLAPGESAEVSPSLMAVLNG